MRKSTRRPTRARRPRRRRKSVFGRKLALFLALLFVGVALVVTAVTSPYLYVTQKRVVGAETVSAEAILKAAKIAPETSILLLPKNEIAKRVKRNPVVKEVRVYRRLPNMVVLRIEEREPFLTLDAGGSFLLVDSKGVP
ncbi:MAG: cell division protein FtsQ/DivIB, partial [Armatimonadota bacterium]